MQDKELSDPTKSEIQRLIASGEMKRINVGNNNVFVVGDPGELKKLDQPSQTGVALPPSMNWEQRILESCLHISWDSFQNVRNTYSERILPDIESFNKNGREFEIMRGLYKIEQQLDNIYENLGRDEGGRLAHRHRMQKIQFLRAISREIRDRRWFQIFPRLWDLTWAAEDWSGMTQPLLSYDIGALWLLNCTPERFLVGVRGEVVRRAVDLSQLPSSGVLPISTISQPFFEGLRYISQREADVSPTRIPNPQDVKDIRFPESRGVMEDALAYAYHHPRYDVPDEGAEVYISNPRDVERVVLVVSGNNLLAKTVTSHGDFFTRVNLDSADWYSSENTLLRASGIHQPGPLVDVIAEAYRDLVTGITRQGGTSTRTFGDSAGDRSTRERVTFIPRVEYIRDPDRLPSYSGPRRPPEPHRVGRHKRRGNMTPAHREVIRRYGQEIGVDILDSLPFGYTYVRAHRVPADSEENFDRLPRFIQRRRRAIVEAELRS